MMSENPANRERTRHVDARVHCLRELALAGGAGTSNLTRISHDLGARLGAVVVCCRERAAAAQEARAKTRTGWVSCGPIRT